MTVAELIELLNDVDDKTKEVVFAYDYGDRSHTEVAESVRDVREEGEVYKSDYFQRYVVVEDDDEHEEHEDEIEDVVILS